MEGSTQQESAYQAARRRMDLLEALASIDWPSACRQMFALYPVACAGYMHDICDSIELWINETGLTADLAGQLYQLISEERDVCLKHRYEQWLDLPTV